MPAPILSSASALPAPSTPWLTNLREACSYTPPHGAAPQTPARPPCAAWVRTGPGDPPAAPQARRSGPSLAPAPQAPKPHVPPRLTPPNPAHLGLSAPSPSLAGQSSPDPFPPGPHPLTPLARVSVRGPQPQPRPRNPVLRAPPAPYPPANRCTSVSLWLILSPACPPGAEAGRGSGRPQRPAASVPGWSRTAPPARRGEPAETRLQKGNRLGPPGGLQPRRLQSQLGDHHRSQRTARLQRESGCGGVNIPMTSPAS